MNRQLIISLCVLILLIACQQPTAYSPRVSDQELAAERAQQQGMSTRHEVELMQKRKEKRLEMEQRLLRVSKPIAAAGADLCIKIRVPGSACVFEFAVENKNDSDGENTMGAGGGINAYADGERIFVTPGMMRFIKSDEELALVLAHEYAHNVMGHIASQRTNAIAGSVVGILLDAAAASQGVNTQGGFSNIGGSLGAGSYSSDFEKEADYVGLYIMTQAGYKTTRAQEFWRRMAQQNPDSITESTTHPTTPERFVAMQKTVDEIAYKRKHGIALLPDMKTADAN